MTSGLKDHINDRYKHRLRATQMGASREQT
jgi:hypothetical protein